MPVIDLHTHSRYSDGTSKPSEVLVECAKKAVILYALTDHDTTQGVEEARAKALSYNIKFLSGVEVSTSEDEHLHFLGYDIDVNNAGLQKFLKENSEKRILRLKRIVKKLRAAGVDLTEEDVFSRVKTTASRAHIADALRHKGIVPSRQEGFRKFLIHGAPGYEPSEAAAAKEALARIKNAGGKAVIAHPGLVRHIWDFKKWADYGLDGVEVFYPSHNMETVQELSEICARHGFFATAGSDNHGPASGRTPKTGMDIPAAHYDRLLKVFNL